MGRRPTEAKAAPVAELVACGTCGLPIARGDQRGCAVHDCGFVLALKEAAGQTPAVSVDAVRQVLLRRIRDSAATASPKEAADLLNAIRELAHDEGVDRAKSTEGEDPFRAWINSGSPRPWG